jgi:predicted RND superfamily exporter protein
LKNYNPEIAIQNTLNNVMIPMATTTIAALIGFKAMSMGELTFLGEMGKIMSYGVTACFLVAITLIPAILVSYENFKIYLMKKWRN